MAGGNARFPHYAFGRLIGFTSGWVAFLGAVTVGPIMVQATLLYTSNYIPSLTTVSGGRPVLTAQGYVVAAALLLLFCTINVLGVRWLAETNKLAVCWKIFVPALTVVALLAASAHGENFNAGGGFMPYGWKGVFLALASGGVVFACLGFEQAVQLGGESRNPGRNIPLAIIGGMVACVGLYIGLQVAFIAALDPSSLGNGWDAVSFSGKAELFGPFAGLATGLGLGWLAVLLYTAAIVSPGGTGLHYTGASARLSYVLAWNGYVPGAFARLTSRGTPLFAIAFSFLCAWCSSSRFRAGSSSLASSLPRRLSRTRWCRSRSELSGVRIRGGRAPSDCPWRHSWHRLRLSSRVRSRSSPAGPWSGS